jgi:hypothetical protein
LAKAGVKDLEVITALSETIILSIAEFNAKQCFRYPISTRPVVVFLIVGIRELVPFIHENIKNTN